MFNVRVFGCRLTLATLTSDRSASLLRYITASHHGSLEEELNGFNNYPGERPKTVRLKSKGLRTGGVEAEGLEI